MSREKGKKEVTCRGIFFLSKTGRKRAINFRPQCLDYKFRIPGLVPIDCKSSVILKKNKAPKSTDFASPRSRFFSDKFQFPCHKKHKHNAVELKTAFSFEINTLAIVGETGTVSRACGFGLRTSKMFW